MNVGRDRRGRPSTARAADRTVYFGSADGALEPDLGRLGNGLEFKRDDAGRYAV
jgi:hypothetical protein